MAIDIETPSFVMIPPEKIVSKLPVRDLSPSGLERIQESMRKFGFLENYPITVAPLEDGTYMLVEGNHRTVSAEKEGISLIPCLVKHGLSEEEMYRLAIQSNSASTTSVPMTMVTYAKFIWDRLAEKDERDKKRYTQKQVGDMLGWGEDKVSNYSLLRQIDEKAWEIISSSFENPTTSEKKTSASDTDAVGENPTTVGFSETLLRIILDLKAEQQLELVQAFANPDKDKPISKGKFTELAKAYRARNEMKEYATAKLGDLGATYTDIPLSVSTIFEGIVSEVETNLVSESSLNIDRVGYRNETWTALCRQVSSEKGSEDIVTPDPELRNRRKYLLKETLLLVINHQTSTCWTHF